MQSPAGFFSFLWNLFWSVTYNDSGYCVFTISQDICVAVPVEFGAVASVGDSYISCNGASDQDICTGCGEVVPPVPETVVPQV